MADADNVLSLCVLVMVWWGAPETQEATSRTGVVVAFYLILRLHPAAVINSCLGDFA